MGEGDRPRHGVGPEEAPAAYRYVGLYDSAAPPPSSEPEQTAPLGIGSWSAGTEEVTAPSSEPADAWYSWPPTESSPARASARRPAPARAMPGRSQPTRRTGLGVVVLVAALTALLVGAAAGYVGSRLGSLSRPSSASSLQAPAATPALPASSTGARAPLPPAPRTLNAVAVAKAALPGTVMIRVSGSGGTSVGSGFVLDTKGMVVTNNHVVAAAGDGAALRAVFSDGASASASLVGRSPTYDIAVIRLHTSHALVPLAVGDSDKTRVGESVLAIGSPLALPGTVTEGIVSATKRPVAVGQKGNTADAYISGTQTDAPINPGNSGGPLIDAGARVIGVNSAILTLNSDQQQAGNIGIGFAIPINQAMEVARLLIANGRATYPVIGADVADAPDQSGVKLTNITSGGPADQAGLRTGDVVTRLDRQPVSASEELIVAIRSHRPGERVTLAYRRDGRSQETAVILGSREG